MPRHNYARKRLRFLMRQAALNYRVAQRLGYYDKAAKFLRTAVTAREASNLT